MEPENCTSCEHSSDDHRLDDTLNLDPTDPGTPFRCILCSCPNMIWPHTT